MLQNNTLNNEIHFLSDFQEYSFEKIKDEEATKLLDEELTKQQALTITEQTGIVFIDELDKVAQTNESQNVRIYDAENSSEYPEWMLQKMQVKKARMEASLKNINKLKES